MLCTSKQLESLRPKRTDSPSLSMSHNSDEVTQNRINHPDLPFKLTGSQAKTAFALEHNVKAMIREAGLDCCVFTTFTIGNQTEDGFVQIFDVEEASRRWNNLNSSVIPALFERAVVVSERHKSGAIHFHLIGILLGRPDIRSGFDFSAARRHDYRSANDALRHVWQYLRDTLPGYSFGRAETMPIEKCAEAVACYAAKYVEKNLFNRLREDKGKKLVRYIGFNRKQLKPNDFSWATEGAQKWRRNARVLAGLVTLTEREQMKPIFGSKWAFRLTQNMRELTSSVIRDGSRWEFIRECLIHDADEDAQSYLRERIAWQELVGRRDHATNREKRNRPSEFDFSRS